MIAGIRADHLEPGVIFQYLGEEWVCLHANSYRKITMVTALNAKLEGIGGNTRDNKSILRRPFPRYKVII